MISGLRQRTSQLPAGSAEAVIARAALESDTGTAAADLRLAKIKADVESSNWLPTLGPNLSLSSLESLASSLLLDVVIFDNGQKRAEREYAVTDVEVAAVNLAIDANDRVLDALDAYLLLLEAQSREEISTRALTVLEGYARKSAQRVSQGYSAPVEQSEIEQYLSEFRLVRDAARQSAMNARSSLTLLGVSNIPGSHHRMTSFPATPSSPPLSVTLAQAKANRSIAEAKIDRSKNFPLLGGTTEISSSGSSTVFVMSGSGMGASTLSAGNSFEASKQASNQSVIHARSEAEIEIDSLNSELSSLSTQLNGYSARLSSSMRNYELYKDQFTAGAADLTDVVDAYATAVSLELGIDEVKHDILGVKYDLLHAYGVLFDGSSI